MAVGPINGVAALSGFSNKMYGYFAGEKSGRNNDVGRLTR